VGPSFGFHRAGPGLHAGFWINTGRIHSCILRAEESKRGPDGAMSAATLSLISGISLSSICTSYGGTISDDESNHT
jgi:hypothetical protein